MLFLVALICLGLNDATGGRIHMESVRTVREDFVQLIVVTNKSETHEVVIAIKQRNPHVLEDELTRRSDPGSAMYQQWMSYEQISELTENTESAAEITNWLTQREISVSGPDNVNYITARGTIEQWEDIFATEFFIYHDLSSKPTSSSSVDNKHSSSTNHESGNYDSTETQSRKTYKRYLRAQSYSIPAELAPHISCVFNTIQIPPSLHRRTRVRRGYFASNLRDSKRNSSVDETEEGADVKAQEKQSFKTYLRVRPTATSPESTTVVHPHNVNNNNDDVAKSHTKSAALGSEDGDDGYYANIKPTTVASLNTLYNIESNIGTSGYGQAVFETADEYFSPVDLHAFQRHYGLTEQEAVDVGGYSVDTCSTTDYGPSCYEGNLDIQYLMGVAQVTTTYYWYIDDTRSPDPFVAWIQDVSRAENPPKSLSISWGENEVFVSASIMNAFNTEALKLSAMGVTIVAASGDDGVAGDYCSECKPRKAATPVNCPCDAESGSRQSYWAGSGTWNGKGYFPSFPTTSPYVVAVGATMGPETDSPEYTCQSNTGGVIISGGGFSTFYPTPAWQTAAVDAYFSGLTAAQTPAPGFNRRGRGYPDISLLGVWYQTAIALELVSLFGTSASTPVFAAMISLVNAKRLTVGLPTVGHIHPTLYAAAGKDRTIFNDVTEGHIKCCGEADESSAPRCCNSGFHATAGWDPTTGWGSIDYPQLYAMFLPADTKAPTSSPSPTAGPTTANPSSLNPAVAPTLQPSSRPLTATPTHTPLQSTTPTIAPFSAPTASPTSELTPSPTENPTEAPTVLITVGSTLIPTIIITDSPTVSPTSITTASPTVIPAVVPTAGPTDSEITTSEVPTVVPTERKATISKSIPGRNSGYASGRLSDVVSEEEETQ